MTVGLPSPPPASGKLYVGINPGHIAPLSHPDLPSGAPLYFLRLVQNVSRYVVITRIVDLKELRGVSLPAPTKEDTARREFRTVNEVADQIIGATTTLTNAVSTKRGEYEVCLFDDAVIYVPESAPVFLRIDKGFAVSAAEAADDVENYYHRCPCPMEHPTVPGSPVSKIIVTTSGTDS
jgi:hypothetical protein